MKILFAGSPEIAVPSLEKLNAHYKIAAVLTNPDKEKGRGKKLSLTAVKEKALDLGLEIFQPVKLDNDAIEEIGKIKADLLVCFAYGKIFPKAFLDIFPMGGVNVHPSLLPEYRGASPINSAILDRKNKTGITIQEIALKMDSGDILNQVEIPLFFNETTESLSEKVSHLAAVLIADTLQDLPEYRNNKKSQNDSEASYCKIISKEDGLISWERSSEETEAAVRAYMSWPKAFTYWKEKKLFILESEIYHGDVDSADLKCGKVAGVDKKSGILIKTGNGFLAVRVLQLEAKKAMDFKSFLNGNKDIIGQCLGENK